MNARGGANIGSIYEVRAKYDLSRVGSHWMSGRLKLGDWLVCYRHSGDCFYDYKLVHNNTCCGATGRRLVKALADVPAYTLGREIHKLNPKQLNLLLEGGAVRLGGGCDNCAPGKGDIYCYACGSKLDELEGFSND